MELDSEWVVGFTDGEGCFYVGIYSHPEMTAGYQVLPELTIVQHKRDIKVLYALKRFFRCGVVRQNREDRYCLRIRKIECLERVVGFFDKHPLKTRKNVEFKRFAKVVRMMKEGKHLEIDGLLKIVEIASKMNRANSDTLKDIKKILESRIKI